MGGSSNTQQSNTENNTDQFANYEDGWQINAGENASVTVDNSNAEVAITAIEEAGAFAENAAIMNETMHAVNTQLADNTIRDAFIFSNETNKNTLQFADNAINDNSQLAGMAMANNASLSRNAMQFADNAMMDNFNFSNAAINTNSTLMNDMLSFLGFSLDKNQESINGVVSASAAQSSGLAKSVMNMASAMKTGSTDSTRAMTKIVTYVAVGTLAWMVLKK